MADPGHIGASQIAVMLAGGEGLTRDTLRWTLAVERLTNQHVESYESFDMRRGKLLEPDAIAIYEWEMGETLTYPVPFVPHPKIAWAGCTPDALTESAGLAEFKCPKVKTHGQTLLGAKVSRVYRLQAQWQMACADRGYDDWCSYHPEFPEDMQLFRHRFYRDKVPDVPTIAELEKAVRVFVGEVDMLIDELLKKHRGESGILLDKLKASVA